VHIARSQTLADFAPWCPPRGSFRAENVMSIDT
jgi:hypothetical protein